MDDTTVDSADIHRCTSKDPFLSKVYQDVWSGTNIPEGSLYSVFHTKRYKPSVENRCLLWGSRVIILLTLRKQVLKKHHQCHSGMVKMKALARNDMWWRILRKRLTVAILARAQEHLLQGHHYIPINGLGNPGTGSMWTMPITMAEIWS